MRLIGIATRSSRTAALSMFLLSALSRPCFAAAVPPVITTQPANKTVNALETASFQVTATSLSTLKYQWRKNGAAIPGATASSYTIPIVRVGDQGNYSVNVTNLGGWVASSNAVLTVLQTAPTLDSTKSPALAPENEDAPAPSGAVGTLVSQLVDFASPAGQVDNVTDPDPSALLGIAVTDTDTTHGSWYYSTNNGVLWIALGAVNELNARLLAADAATRLYFKPNTNWNGTLSNAITFRAWDQTIGNNGGTGVARSNGNLLDTFSTVAYTNNDGSSSWTGAWVDSDDSSASSGKITVQNPPGQLDMVVNNNSASIYREANLSGVATATVSFNYNSLLNGGTGGRVDFQVSSNGGTTWTTITSFTSTSKVGTGTFSADISAYAASNTRIRFAITGKSNPTEFLDIDNVQIAFTTSSIGGTSAFSTAKASASLTINPVNDRPVANNQSVTAGGSTPKLITLTATDVDNTTFIFAIVSPPAHGLITSFNPSTGTLTYTSDSTYTGADSFSFVANDGATNSAPATVTITVTAAAPGITSQPQPQSVLGGQSASFSVAASGTAPMRYQWKLNGTNVVGATNSALTLPSVQPANAGSYTVVITNSLGSVTSVVAPLTIIPPTPPNLSSARMTAGGFTFQMTVPTGATCVIFASTDLFNWTPISTNLAATTNIVITDPQAANYDHRFYRATLR